MPTVFGAKARDVLPQPRGVPWKRSFFVSKVKRPRRTHGSSGLWLRPGQGKRRLAGECLCRWCAKASGWITSRAGRAHGTDLPEERCRGCWCFRGTRWTHHDEAAGTGVSKAVSVSRVPHRQAEAKGPDWQDVESTSRPTPPPFRKRVHTPSVLFCIRKSWRIQFLQSLDPESASARPPRPPPQRESPLCAWAAPNNNSAFVSHLFRMLIFPRSPHNFELISLSV